MKFTKGPWVSSRGFSDLLIDGDHEQVDHDFLKITMPDKCYEFDGDFYCSENFVEVHGCNQKANANLIAAAPNMYNALHTICKECEGGEKCYGCAVKHAIAKAKGRTND